MSELEKEVESLQNWTGREESCEETLTSFKAAGYHAMLNTGCYPPQTGEPTPNGIHWMLTRNATPQSELDQDSHSRGGQFLPPIRLLRRMWAGSRIEFI